MTAKRPRPEPERVLRTAARFQLGGEPTAALELRSGHINDSYVITSRDGRRGLLQRINERVFANPRRLMENVERITRHLAERLGPGNRRRRLTLIPADTGRPWIEIKSGRGQSASPGSGRGKSASPGSGRKKDGNGADGWWRMYELIEDVTTQITASSAAQVFRAAQAFGHFQGMLADLPPPPLFETIPRFHDTVSRFEALDRVLAAKAAGAVRGKQAQAEVQAAATHRGLADRLIKAAARGLPQRTVHNDCKISNVLFDRQNGEALCVVDLDTAMPGLAAFDFGDMARSMAHRTDEDARDPEGVEVDLELFGALASGYLDGARFLTPDERQSLVDGALVLTLEQAVRFLTDYLEGDVYFRVERPEQNLERCRVQFALLESLLDREADLRRIVAQGENSAASV
ncbi:MAG: aminoglycoside phosphotransferase family protein [Acidobacteria bacterium]|nr:aminoglycoside phosphotransferase family protein [Acidobacteriota bacterium]